MESKSEPRDLLPSVLYVSKYADSENEKYAAYRLVEGTIEIL